MIIVQLTGGLGNQLFQYAMGKSLSLRTNTELKFDLSFFETYEWHEYSLAPFIMPIVIATKNECSAIKGLRYDKLIPVFFKKQRQWIKEDNLLFKESYKLIKPPAYLSGYWQSEKYFKEFESDIRSDIQFRLPPSKENQVFLNEIIKVNSISLHVRRGNYVTISSVNQVHGTCSLNYYIESIKYMVREVIDPVFFVFSDDINWAKENINYKGFSFFFIDVNDAKTDYEDLRLMSNCRHHILANSTFSWWGAWLNPRNEKIVIAPQKWFADDQKNSETKYLIPTEWIRV